MTATKWRRSRRLPTPAARAGSETPRRRPAWYLIALAGVGVVAAVLGIRQIGSPTSTARTAKQIVTAERGIVQSTVTGSGNVEPAVDDSASFQTSGTLQHLYVKQGDQVVKGQLLATLDPTSAQDTVDQAEQELTAAKDSLSAAESASSSASTTNSSTVVDRSDDRRFVSYSPTGTTETASSTTSTTTSTPTSTTTTTTTPTVSRPTPSPSTTPSPTTTTVTMTAPSTATTPPSGASTGTGAGSGSSAQTTTSNPDTLAANIASAQAQVDSAEATLKSGETALAQTKLYSPATGTVVSVQDVSPGDAVSGSSTSGSGSSSSDASSGSNSSSAGSTTSGSLGGSTGATSTSSTSTGLVEIVNTHRMTVTVPFDESDVSKLKVGQPATVTLNALTDVELAAKVSTISTIGTTSSSVVSYDATLTLTQHNAMVKPGMTASVAVIDKQASGVTLPNSAVSGTGNTATVNVTANGKTTPTEVIVGVRGDSRTQIVKGLSAGQSVVVTQALPSMGGSINSSSGSSSSSGTLGATGSGFGAVPGGAGFGGGGFPGGGGRFGGG